MIKQREKMVYVRLNFHKLLRKLKGYKSLINYFNKEENLIATRYQLAMLLSVNISILRFGFSF